MGRLTEILEAINTPASDLNRELYTSIDLTKHNDEIKEARKTLKRGSKANKNQGLLF